MTLVKSMAQRPDAQHVVDAEKEVKVTQPPQPPVIHVVAGEKVDVIVEERVSSPVKPDKKLKLWRNVSKPFPKVLPQRL